MKKSKAGTGPEKKSFQEGIMFMSGTYMPVKNIELYDEDQQIWKGEVCQAAMQKMPYKIVFFSRQYLPEVNELDQIYKEIHFKPGVLSFEFLLVPKEKILFGYHEPGTILLPSPDRLGPRRRTPHMQ